ncbi:glycosyltransferase [Patescibacteria group bacterium]|nr:glycosyltransferase [Patescibacteria group bacterium]
MSPFFSIVVPTLNEEKFLPRLLTDLTRQKEKDFEIIVADGFSEDGTKDCVNPFRSKFKINFVQTRLKNVAAQRNYGSSLSQGRYLVFIDADARIGPSFLKKIRKAIDRNKGLLFVPYFSPDKQDNQYKPLFDLVNVLVELSQNLPKRFSLGGTIIIEKNFFNLIGGFNEELFMSEDHELVQRAGQWGVKSKFIKGTKVSFSLRRLKKEGQIKFFYKYFVVAARRLFFNEEIKNKIIEYQMGGQFYDQVKNKQKKEEFFNHYLNQIKDLFKKILAS